MDILFELIKYVVSFMIVWDFIIAEFLGVKIYTFLGVKHAAIWAHKNFLKNLSKPTTKNNFYEDA